MNSVKLIAIPRNLTPKEIKYALHSLDYPGEMQLKKVDDSWMLYVDGDTPEADCKSIFFYFKGFAIYKLGLGK